MFTRRTVSSLLNFCNYLFEDLPSWFTVVRIYLAHGRLAPVRLGFPYQIGRLHFQIYLWCNPGKVTVLDPSNWGLDCPYILPWAKDTDSSITSAKYSSFSLSCLFPKYSGPFLQAISKKPGFSVGMYSDIGIWK